MNKSRRIYALTILGTIALLIINQIFIQYSLHKKTQDAEIINISGKQRMFSQRIALYLMKENISEEESMMLSANFEDWKDTHQAFLNPTEKLSLTEFPLIIEQLNSINPNIDFIEKQVKNKLANKPLDRENIYLIQNDFLSKMNNIVNDLQIKSQEKLQFLVLSEMLLLLFTVIIIIIEILYVFRPFVRDIELEINNLKSFCKTQSNILRSPIANIKGYINLIKTESKENETLQNYFSMIHDECTKLDTVTETMKSFIEEKEATNLQ